MVETVVVKPEWRKDFGAPQEPILSVAEVMTLCRYLRRRRMPGVDARDFVRDFPASPSLF
jgi:hypothetical protein